MKSSSIICNVLLYPVIPAFLIVPGKLPLALGSRKLLQFYYNLFRTVHSINGFLNSHGKQVSDGVCKSRVLTNKSRVLGEQYSAHRAPPKRKAVGSNPARDAKPPKTLRFRGSLFSGSARCRRFCLLLCVCILVGAYTIFYTAL